MTLHSTRLRRPRRGAMMVGVAILLPVLFIFAALTINVAYLQLVRTELQIATDAACRAAGRTFAETGDRSLALSAAQAVARRNMVGGRPASVDAGDLEFGTNAVRLTTRSFAQQTDDAFAPIFPIFGAAMKTPPVCSAVNVLQAPVDSVAIPKR